MALNADQAEARLRKVSARPQAAQAYSLSLICIELREPAISKTVCMGIYQIFQNGRVSAEMIK